MRCRKIDILAKKEKLDIQHSKKKEETMIISDLTRADFAQNLPALLAKVCIYLKKQDLLAMPLGRHELTEIHPDIFMNVMAEKIVPAESKKAEMHQKYIDIQLVIQGEEWIECSATMEDLTQYTPYDEKIDCQFRDNIEVKNIVHLKENMFAVFFPFEAHKPCCDYSQNALAPKNEKKLVVKIPASLLQGEA